MRRGTGLYSRLVAILKVLLPLVALGMLASLFLIQTEDRVGGGIVFSEGDTDALGQGLSITNPHFSGSSDSGDHLRFTAERLIPDAAPPTRAEVVGLSGTIGFVDGPEIAVSAKGGEIDITERHIRLDGDVRIESSDGYVLRAPTLAIDLAAGRLEGGDRVETSGPLGRITSGTLNIESAGDAGGHRRFLFGNGVRLVYDPPASN